MSIMEKELANIIVHYEKQKADGTTHVDIDNHLLLAHNWLKREQRLRATVNSTLADDNTK